MTEATARIIALTRAAWNLLVLWNFDSSSTAFLRKSVDSSTKSSQPPTCAESQTGIAGDLHGDSHRPGMVDTTTPYNHSDYHHAWMENKMSEIEVLAQKIADALSPNALWDVSQIATYLHRNERNTSQNIVRQAGFPVPLRIPSGRGEHKPQPLWRAQDVIAWAESHIDA